MTTTTDLNKSIVLKFHAAFERGDLNECRRCLSPDVRVYNTGTPGSQNREQFIQFGQMFLNGFSDNAIRFPHQVTEGEWVSSWGTWKATHTGDFNGIPATGRKIDVQICLLDHIVNAEIVEHRASFDVMGLMQQIGAIPAQA